MYERTVGYNYSTERVRVAVRSMNCGRPDEYRYRPYTGVDSVPTLCLVSPQSGEITGIVRGSLGELHETERVDDAVPCWWSTAVTGYRSPSRLPFRGENRGN
ncbi:hypothetical protein [Natrinema sp. 1APR25-10V2]|uniref:hypothetical protein n=1 Tax=Natrinema sp. 1APR25-10V2 TaxID=2951081 RepID=UPI00287410D4|nr:hypothetical protein [Natrinema sp. 1APR25-10V2]MDS0475881.1 hypothetical protein [Natrinema sp. 1APR25-10V2]